MKVEVDIGELRLFEQKMGRFLHNFRASEIELQEEMAQALVNEIVRNAPRDSGQYAYSWRIAIGVFSSRVYTNSPYALRLEYGFVGYDALGRNYNQAPQPHVRPAIVVVTKMFRTRYARLPREIWEGM